MTRTSRLNTVTSARREHRGRSHEIRSLKVRVERWDALWSIRKRKLETRAKIIGAAVLAELAVRQASAGPNDGFTARLTDILDRVVQRVSDRAVLRDFTGLALPRRPGGARDETYEQALAAIGVQILGLDDEDFDNDDRREGDEEEKLDR